MTTSDLFDGTPTWFKRFMVPMIVGVIVATPIGIGWADNTNRMEDLEKGLLLIDARIAKLEKREDSNRLLVQGIVVKQAVMDSKLDTIIQMMERTQ